MSKRIDLTNKKFGHWTVLNFDEEKSNSHSSYWICKCICGTIKSVRSSHLRSGASTSCGCVNSKIKIGDTFGFLEVISLNEQLSGQGKGRYWNCICHNCNQSHCVDANTLSRGHSLSCGCLKMSKGEYDIEQFLIAKNIKFIKQYSFLDLKPNNYPLKFDFAIFNPSIKLIEYQGRQHYQPVDFYGGQDNYKKQQERDLIKKQYCENHNIPLYEISYKDNLLEKMEEIIDGST